MDLSLELDFTQNKELLTFLLKYLYFLKSFYKTGCVVNVQLK